MQEANWTLIVIALIGVAQVGLSIFFGRRSNEASAEKDEAIAEQQRGKSYADLVDRLEARLAAADRREERTLARITALEEKCKKYEKLIEKYERILESLE